MWPSTRTRSPSRRARCESASTRLLRRRRRRGGPRPPAPGCCPRRRRWRWSCRPSRPRSLVNSRISTARPVKSPRPSLLNSSASMPAVSNSRRCCWLRALVGREQDDAVQLAPPAMLLQVVLILEDVGVHQQRLAAAGGAPVGELVELRPGFGGSSKGAIWSASGLSAL